MNDGYTGVTTQARIDDTNAQELSLAATSGAQQAVVGDMSGDEVPVMFRPVGEQDPQLLALSTRITGWLSKHNDQYQARTTEDFSDYICISSCTATVSVNDAENPTDFIMTFSNCVSDNAEEIVTLNGSVHATTNDDQMQFTNVYENFTISTGDFSETINMTVSCIEDVTVAASCNFTSDFTGIDGRTYRVADMSVSGDDFSGWSVEGRVYDPDYGYIDITTAVPLILDCPNGSPSIGRIVFSDAEGTSAGIEFISCAQYVVTFDGTGNTYDW